MNISVIYDNNDKGITYKSVQFILKEIQNNNINTSVKELFIPEDFNMISDIWDCYSTCRYFYSYEGDSQSCVYINMVKRISSILNKSDLIILASSTSHHNIGPQMYMLLEHLTYQWLPHRLNNLMVNKIALAISDTTSLTIFSYANMTLSRILRFWGINKCSIFSKSLSKYNSENLSKKKQDKLSSELNKLSLKIVNKYRQTSAVIIPNFKNNNFSTTYASYKTSIFRLPNNSFRKKFINKKLKNRKIL